MGSAAIGAFLRRLAVWGGEAAVFAAFLGGLAIEDPRWFTLFVLAVAGVVLYGALRLRSAVAALLASHRRAAVLGLLALVFVYPFFHLENPYLIHVGTIAGLYVLMALGLNITVGYAGLFDFGYAAYYAIGAYCAAILSVSLGWPFWLTMPAAVATAALGGALVAAPALRVRGHYLALVTLGFGQIVYLLAINLESLTGGVDGIGGIPSPRIGAFAFLSPVSIGGFRLPYQVNFYYLVALAAIVLFVFTRRIVVSRQGRALASMLDDEVAAACSGIDVVRYKVGAFASGASFGGLSGAIYAHMVGYIDPQNFPFFESVVLLCMVIMGGAGNPVGVVVGAVLLTFIPEKLRIFQDYRMLLFGLSLVFLMLYRPAGLFPPSVRRREVKGDLRRTASRVQVRSSRPTGTATSAPGDGGKAYLLQTVDLCKTFGGVQALDHVSIGVRPGEVLGIIGPNGSGKTTLFNVITGVIPPTAGRALLGDPPINLVELGPSAIVRHGVARTFQNLRLFPRLTVLENVLVGMHRHLTVGVVDSLLQTSRFRREEDEAAREALELLARFGEDFAANYNKPAGALSYADRRRLEIVRALASRPRLLLLDEPAAGMNKQEMEQLRRDILRINREGVTVVVIDHKMRFIEGVTQQVLVLHFGQKIAEGKFHEIRGNERVVEAYLGRAYARATT